MFFDTHCHLNHECFQSDLENVLEKANEAGIERILVPGWDIQSSKLSIKMSEKYPQLFSAVGIHPSECLKISQDSIKEIQKMADHPKVLAIGEIGLDYYYGTDDIDQQKHLFHEMLDTAASAKKRVILHSRQAMSDLNIFMLEWLNEINGSINIPAIFHAFEGNLNDANVFLQYGCKFGVGGPLTYKNSHQKRETFSQLPDTSIFFETDAPYLPPAKHRGERNEPSYLPLVAAKLSELRNQDIDILCERIFENSYKMINEDFIH